ncbi:MAG: hypothetical protein L0Z62_47990 [Gemmataceae bacterium]|nr:hypothetical protein [Gemmataceae bacterium]
MNRRWLVNSGWLLAVAVTAGASGCVERRYTVLVDAPCSNVPGAVVPAAVVLENGRPVGPAPVTRPFQYYGTYEFTIIRDGFQTLKVQQPIRAPWYEYFPLDFIAENLIPWTIRDVREFHYSLQPVQVDSAEAVYGRAETMRQQGHTIGEPPTPPPGVLLPPGAVPPGQPPAQMPPPDQVPFAAPQGQFAPGQIPQVQPLPPAR